MYKAINIDDDLLCELNELPPGDDDDLLSFKVNQAIRFYFRNQSQAEAERMAIIASLQGSLAGPEGEDLARRVADSRRAS